eukprot:3097530-Prymnesium_polylepis.1
MPHDGEKNDCASAASRGSPRLWLGERSGDNQHGSRHPQAPTRSGTPWWKMLEGPRRSAWPILPGSLGRNNETKPSRSLSG